jgi:hypothetical protein
VPGVPLLPFPFDDIDPAVKREGYRAAEEQARQELGDVHRLIDVGEPATIKGLMKELDIKERLDGLIFKSLKQWLMVRRVKFLSPAPFRGRCRKFQAPEKQADTKVLLARADSRALPSGPESYRKANELRRVVQT